MPHFSALARLTFGHPHPQTQLSFPEWSDCASMAPVPKAPDLSVATAPKRGPTFLGLHSSESLGILQMLDIRDLARLGSASKEMRWEVLLPPVVKFPSNPAVASSGSVGGYPWFVDHDCYHHRSPLFCAHMLVCVKPWNYALENQAMHLLEKAGQFRHIVFDLGPALNSIGSSTGKKVWMTVNAVSFRWPDPALQLKFRASIESLIIKDLSRWDLSDIAKADICALPRLHTMDLHLQSAEDAAIAMQLAKSKSLSALSLSIGDDALMCDSLLALRSMETNIQSQALCFVTSASLAPRACLVLPDWLQKLTLTSRFLQSADARHAFFSAVRALRELRVDYIAAAPIMQALLSVGAAALPALTTVHFDKAFDVHETLLSDFLDHFQRVTVTLSEPLVSRDGSASGRRLERVVVRSPPAAPRSSSSSAAKGEHDGQRAKKPRL